MPKNAYAVARRAALFGPLITIAGAVLIYLGASGTATWLLILPGVPIALFGLVRTSGGLATLGLERRRARLLREGVEGTALVKSSRQVTIRYGVPVMDMELEVETPGRNPSTQRKVGGVPWGYAEEVAEGAELPVRIDRKDPSNFALDWDRL
jgi:hypothetical protein